MFMTRRRRHRRAPLVTFTPEDPTDYHLAMFEGGFSEQLLGLTRDEYRDLKAHLAAMRGHVLVVA
jgi:hypothetical protein